MKTYFKKLGPQRIALTIMVLLVIVMSPLADLENAYEGWKVIPSVVAPSLVPILIFVVTLDIIMSLVFRLDKNQEQRARYNYIIISHLIILVCMIAAWVPYMLQIVYR